jgi:hypothetical protein
VAYDQWPAKSDLQARSFRAGTEDFGGNLGREGFETREGPAGGEARPFQEGGIEHESAAVHEGMIGGFEGFARTARTGGAGDEIFVHFKIRLKVEGVADVPAVVAREAGEKFLAEGGSFLPGHRLGFAVVFGVNPPGDNFYRADSDGEQSFTLEKIQEIAIENGVNLQAVAAVLDDVGIDEAGDGALAEEGFAEALREKGGQVVGGRFGFRS